VTDSPTVVLSPTSLDPIVDVTTAAELMRQCASRATAGPWHSSSVYSPASHVSSAVYSQAHPMGSVESEVCASGRLASRHFGGIRNPHDAVHAAGMDPIVTAMIARTLDAVAAEMRYDRVREIGGELYDNTALKQPRPVWTEAWRTARQYLYEDDALSTLQIKE
jgi:hypothetical protein